MIRRLFIIGSVIILFIYFFIYTRDLQYEQKELNVTDQFITQSLLGMTETEVLQIFGEPTRIDMSAYGYEWWVYADRATEYIQIGWNDEEVVTVILAGEILAQYNLHNKKYADVNKRYSFMENVEINNERGTYRFVLSPIDLKARPLVQIDDKWIQINFDIHEDIVTSIRMMNENVLLQLRPYALSYRGVLKEDVVEGETNLEDVQISNEKQVIDFTNFIRNVHSLDPLVRDDGVDKVAYVHSKDMSTNNYFSHTSPTFGDLSDRLMNEGILFTVAGENIAADYIDGIAAVSAWLNSPSHRYHLLHDEYTHIGVGVFEKYYTQNFIQKE